MWKFDPCVVSQAFRFSENFLLFDRKAPEIAAFRVPQVSAETDVRTITYQNPRASPANY
jgi:hypothetical protein